MILKGTQRADGMQLARHLLKTEDNDHVEIHELKGLSRITLKGALKEIHAVCQRRKIAKAISILSEP
ncbi:MAG: hypothetical protein R3F37_17260 [Candidatus Competibacteraceae bacterium]